MKIPETKSNNTFLSFIIQGQYFALRVKHIDNILKIIPITEVPLSPDYLLGVTNIRGSVLPVIDTAIKLNMGKSSITSQTCILSLLYELNDETVQAGALVDVVEEVFTIQDEDILPPETMGAKYDPGFVTGIINNNKKFIMLIDAAEVFGEDENAFI